uniref:Anaphase-promoting complex subunit 10 n=1 Tax=Romanomermis culicivorax TaxID=13658 RepID=A0A915I9F7_ROMCU
MDRSSTSTEAKLKDLKSLLPPSLIELNSRAVWSLSSCKAGYGIDHLLDNNVETYWQSDGAQPHLVNIMFRKKTAVSHVALYADLKADESYTPSRLSLRVGTHFNDLIDIKQIELKVKNFVTSVVGLDSKEKK